MKIRNSVLFVLAALMFAAPLMAQDGGAPDSIKMVFTTPPVVGTNVPVVVQCSVFVDADQLSTLQFAFTWDNPNFILDTAIASAQLEAMEIGPFFYLDNVRQTTNDSDIAICSGTSIFTNYPPAAGWRHLATFNFHLTEWTSTSFLRIDTIQTPTYASTDYLFLPLGGTDYDPIWKGPLTFGNQALNILVSPSVLNNSADESGPSPTPDTIDVTADGGASIGFNLSESIPWLTLNKTTGNTPDEFVVEYNTSSLAPGTYADSIQVSSSEADNSPFWVKVNLTVMPVSKYLEVSPDTLYFTAQENSANPAQQSYSVIEIAGFPIVYTVNENSSRITLNKTGGTAPDSVGVTVNIAGLVPGVYIDSVIVASGEAANSPITEYIRTEITPAPKFLEVTPDSLYFYADAGGANPPAQKFTVAETNGYNIAYSLSEFTDWISLDKTGGMTPDSVTVSVDITGLTPGIYTSSVSVGSLVAGNSPLTIGISLTIAGQSQFLLVTPNSIGPSIVQGGPPFDPISIYVTDSLGLGLSYSVTEDVGWLNISPASGTTPDSFWVIADTLVVNALTPGFYFDTITVTSAEAGNSPVNVHVALEVLATPNNPPVITAIEDYSIFEGDNLVVSVMATDADDDAIFLFTGALPDFATFFDSGNGNGYFDFNPGFADAGVYPITVHASDANDTSSQSFTLTVLDQEPGSEGDTLFVGTVPAVPGQQVIVPIDIANSCNLHAIFIPIQWDGDNFIVLDSIIFNDALVGHLTAKTVEISNDSNFALITVQVIAPDLPIPPGHALLANMHFSLNPVTPGGAYAVSPGLTTTTFTRDCSGGGVGPEVVIPIIPGGGGNIVVDTTNVYVCGYVVDEDGVGILGATVELWGDYPCDGPLQTTTTNGEGFYAFTNFSLGNYDLYAWKRGVDSTTWNDAYYPNTVHVNFGENGIIIELKWLDELVPSDVWVDYFCDLNTLFGCSLPVGSIVEVRDPQNTLSGRQFVSDAGVYRFMPVYRDSSGSVEDEGATTGDNLRFYINGVQALTSGNTIYPAAYAQIEVCLAGGARLTKECLLNTGWNLVSWNLDTDTDEIEEVLNSLSGCIEVVLGFEAGGLTYVPGMDIFNTLSAVDHLSGYWIKLADACNHTLEISGVPVDQDTPIPVRSGWNLVSYLPNDVLAIGDALYSLDGNLQIAYTYDGTPLVFVPPADPVFNTLTEMEPCFGYWLKLNNAGVLTYPAANGAMPKIDWPIAQEVLSAEVKFVEPTRNWVNMYAHNLTVDAQPVSIGATVTAHTLNGNVIGHYVMKETGTFGFMPVYADADGEASAGIKKGDNFYLSVDGNRTNEEFTWTEQGDLIEAMALTTGAGGNTLPESYSLAQNYPNPFNPTTTISFTLPVASNARIEIFNLLGQVVATPFDGQAEAGEHKVVWDGKSTSGESVSSGIYLYRLTAGDFVKSLKMTLVK